MVVFRVFCCAVLAALVACVGAENPVIQSGQSGQLTGASDQPEPVAPSQAVLVENATVRGTVLSSHGASVSGVTVALLRLPDPGLKFDGQWIELRTVSGASGADGQFEFQREVFEGPWLITVNPGGGGMFGTVVRGAGRSGETIDAGELLAPRNGLVRGRIVDASAHRWPAHGCARCR